MIPTTTDAVRRGWSIHDEVIRLRLHASDLAFPLPSARGNEILIGTGPECTIRIEDPSNFTSRAHATLEHSERGWRITDRSKNGIFLDDLQCERFLLAPGHEIGIGRRTTLIAESARTLVLRAALARMIGWAPAHAGEIDRALRMLRLAATGRAIFALCGSQPLMPLAEELHRLALTEQRPFVLCSPRRAGEAARSTKRVATALEALSCVADGTICIDDARRPRDLVALLDEWRRPTCAAQLVVLAKRARRAAVYTPAPVVVPPLSERREEVERLIAEYEAEAVQRLGVAGLELAPVQRTWICERSSDSLSEIQTATLRLAALRHAGTVAGAAALLRISHVSMGQWLERRRLRADLSATWG